MSILKWLRRKPLTEKKVFGDVGPTNVFKLKDLYKVITTCPNGSRILITDRIWIQVNHLGVPE